MTKSNKGLFSLLQPIKFILMPQNCYLKLKKIFFVLKYAFFNLAKASACDSIKTS